MGASHSAENSSPSPYQRVAGKAPSGKGAEHPPAIARARAVRSCHRVTAPQLHVTVEQKAGQTSVLCRRRSGGESDESGRRSRVGSWNPDEAWELDAMAVLSDPSAQVDPLILDLWHNLGAEGTCYYNHVRVKAQGHSISCIAGPYFVVSNAQQRLAAFYKEFPGVTQCYTAEAVDLPAWSDQRQYYLISKSRRDGVPHRLRPVRIRGGREGLRIWSPASSGAAPESFRRVMSTGARTARCIRRGGYDGAFLRAEAAVTGLGFHDVSSG